MKHRTLITVTAATLVCAVQTYAYAVDSLSVATDTSYMPFEFKQDGKYVGFDLDLWAQIAKDQGWAYKVEAMDFNGIIPALQTRNIDGSIAAMAITEPRKKVVDFSVPYYNSGHASMVQAGNSSIKSWDDLNGKVVASKTGTTTIDWINKTLKPKELRQFPNIDSEILALEAGRVDAVIEDTPVVIYYVNHEGKGKVKVAGQPVNGEPYGLAFPKGSPLVPKVNASIEKMMTDGRYAEIYRKWFNEDPPKM